MVRGGGEVKPGGKEGNWSEAKNMGGWSTYLNYDTMGDLVFGERFNCVGQGPSVPPELIKCAAAFIYPAGLLFPYRDSTSLGN
jgi:hypothetical protein